MLVFGPGRFSKVSIKYGMQHPLDFIVVLDVKLLSGVRQILWLNLEPAPLSSLPTLGEF